jgi:hypothetical protein
MTRETSSARRAARLGITLAVSAAILVDLMFLVDIYAGDRTIELFDLDEGGLVTWASSSATFAVAVIALLLSFIDPTQRWRGVALAAGTAYMSFDDAEILHERLASEVTDALGIAESYDQAVWPIFYFPLLAGVALLLLQLGQRTPAARRLILVGLGCLALGVVLEVAGIGLDKLDYELESWPRTVEALLEEGIELAGWILIATGAAVRVIILAGSGPADPPIDASSPTPTAVGSE